MNTAPDLLTVEEVARRLRVAVATVRRYLDAGQLEGIQLGAHRWGPVRISAASLDEALRRWSRNGSARPKPERFEAPPTPITPNPPKTPKPPSSVAGWN
jgi:excisionase family DNA binding protein